MQKERSNWYSLILDAIRCRVTELHSYPAIAGCNARSLFGIYGAPLHLIPGKVLAVVKSWISSCVKVYVDHRCYPTLAIGATRLLKTVAYDLWSFVHLQNTIRNSKPLTVGTLFARNDGFRPWSKLKCRLLHGSTNEEDDIRQQALLVSKKSGPASLSKTNEFSTVDEEKGA
jgi:hypothetical protein